ncbi:uncharacterized protein AB675_761 [Cyphellophora attinorum]|uniref:Uncharacterized protein n=1 Tax=Cyphellophora attinorum TaxID=1664694 RepID=A0A0N1P281_9EURO|nr:uncharacterized protein AB675_761 [Phialophora attinorum]KPI46086.1 hypothetical protein AB675_761 [Phialophora attinorum]
MPIKLPKGFQRRKSSGNALEEAQSPKSPGGTSSFRVIERPGANNKSFDGGSLIRAVHQNASTPALARGSFEQDDENMFRVSSSSRPDATNRGSGGTDNSLSTAQYDSAASSSRLSVSTNPSSLDAHSDRNVQAQYKDIPAPPAPSARPGFLRNSARTFSLGITGKSRESLTSSPAGPPLPPLPLEARGRAATASSASTATPPRLYDSDLALDSSELDGFENMFEGIGSSSRDQSPGLRNSRYGTSPSNQCPPSSYVDSTQSRSARAPAPKPISTSRYDAVDEAPHSWASQNSQNGLMRSPSPSRTITQGSPTVPAHASFSVGKTRPINRKPLAGETASLSKERTNSSSNDGRNLLRKTETWRSEASDNYASALDPALLESADLANQWAETKPAAVRPPPSGKVMTPAQFERYRRQQEEDRKLGASRDSDSEDEVNYDDDDEEEKEKEAAKQRRKQEAHLSVYRQQMMKVTGEQATGRQSSLGQTLDPRMSPSPNALDNRMSHLTVGTQQSGRSSGDEPDEDEDVPLGILAAHGFPNKNRAPTQLLQSTSNPNLRTIAQQNQQSTAPAPSIAGTATNRGSMPVFARQLPADPYYGASVVNPMHRESINMAAQAPMPSGASTAHPVHPAGLVGVIAGEEKARAMRRGSPNTQGNYDLPPSMQHPGLPRSQTMGPGGLTPGDHAQIQMSQQMTQMMQMQMQWMQQMQQIMGGQMMPPGPGTPGGGMPMMPPGMMPMPGMPMPGMPMPQSAPSMAGGRPPTIHMNSAPA